MTATEDRLDLPVPPRPQRPTPARVHQELVLVVRWSLALAAAAVVGWFVATRGIPFDRNTIVALGVLVAAPLVWRGRGLSVLRLVADWVAFAVLLALYDLGRHAASLTDIPVSYGIAPRLDRDVFGVLPTVWLQQHLDAHSYRHWYAVPFSLLYTSHFVVPIVTLLVLYVRDRRRFYGYELRFVGVTALALLLFLVHPTAPPWLDGALGVIPNVHRSAQVGFTMLHLHVASAIFAVGDDTSNVVAAFPSLHATYPMLLTAFLWRRVRWWWRVVLAAYVVGMGFMLVATAEHWVSDVLAGWLLALAVNAAAGRWERRRDRRRAARVPG